MEQLMIASRHECARARRTSPLARGLCGVSHDRERTVTPVGAVSAAKKKPADGYLNAAVCMRVRYVAVHRGLESKPRHAAALRRAAPVWKCGLGQGHGASRR